MYLREDYSVEFYYRLMNGLKQQAGKLNPFVNPSDFDKKRCLLRALEVVEVRGISIGSRDFTNNVVDVALRKILGFRERKGELGKYLRKYEEEYYDDLRAGRHKGFVGEQRGLEFVGSVRCIGPDGGRLTESDRVGLFKGR